MLRITRGDQTVDLSEWCRRGDLLFTRWCVQIDQTPPDVVYRELRAGAKEAAWYLLLSPHAREQVEPCLQEWWQVPGVGFTYAPGGSTPPAIDNPHYTGTGTLYRLRAPGKLGSYGYLLIEMDINGPVVRHTTLRKDVIYAGGH